MSKKCCNFAPDLWNNLDTPNIDLSIPRPSISRFIATSPLDISICRYLDISEKNISNQQTNIILTF